jgi:hypothetical protein
VETCPKLSTANNANAEILKGLLFFIVFVFG